MTNTNISQKLYIGVVIAILSLFFAYILSRIYTRVNMQCLQNAEKIFESSIQKDKKIRQKASISTYHRFSSPTINNDSITIKTKDSHTVIIKTESTDSLSEEEKLYINIQLYLAIKNPIQATTLDSLFNTELLQRRIPAQTAVIYTIGDKTKYSNVDRSFYHSAHALKAVIIGSNREIVLQAYVKFSPTFLIGQSLYIYIMLFLIWIGIIAILIWWGFIRKKKNIILPQNIVNTHMPETARELTVITDSLSLDKFHSYLIYQKTEIILTKKQLDLFIFLLENQGQFVPSQTILENLWPKETVSSSALTSAVKRLKQDIKDIPCLIIESKRNKGYQIYIKTEESFPTNSEQTTTDI